MPTAAEVSAALAVFTTVRGQQSTAKDNTTTQQGDMANLREPVDALIRDMWDTIEFNLRTLDGPAKRRRAREWGVVYIPRAGEPADPTPVPTPAAPATPPPASPQK